MFAIHKATETAKVSFTNDKVEELHSRLDLENVCMIIVDEVLTPSTLLLLTSDFNNSNSNLFGGMPTMFSGSTVVSLPATFLHNNTPSL
jgi:hypothetical protein